MENYHFFIIEFKENKESSIQFATRRKDRNVIINTLGLECHCYSWGSFFTQSSQYDSGILLPVHARSILCSEQNRHNVWCMHVAHFITILCQWRITLKSVSASHRQWRSTLIFKRSSKSCAASENRTHRLARRQEQRVCAHAYKLRLHAYVTARRWHRLQWCNICFPADFKTHSQ